MFYSIGEVAKALEISPQSLYQWEQQGFIPKPHRTPTNHRRYSSDNIKAIREFLSQKNLTTK